MKLTGKMLRIAGPQGPITLIRDDGGVPRVQATRFGDLPYGLGWVHAHDRMVQMMLVRILGRGEASEHLDGSEQMVATDTFMRRMGFRRDARQQATEISDTTRSWCQAYCQGVNDYLERERRPLELLIVGYRPDPWTVEDVLLTVKLVAYMGLAQAQQTLEKFIIQAHLAGVDPLKLRALFSPHLDSFDPAWIQGLTVAEPVIPLDMNWARAVPTFKASNNWVVAGRKTAAGSPILCNDPHLECDRLPAVWYETRLVAGESYLIGATIPGVPGVLIGRNRKLSWGVTYGFMDQIDYFVEDCRDGRFRRGDSWVPFDSRQEVIRVKGGPDRKIRVHENLHGVLEGDPFRPGRYLCRAWSGFQGNVARTADSIVALTRASSVREGAEIVQDVTISLNWVLADRDGDVAYQQSGVPPLRAEGHSGLHPVPGWDPAYDWKGWGSPTDLHNQFNPRKGYLVTANNDLNPPGGPLVINMPMGDYRARRISQCLEAGDQIEVEDMKKLQLDRHSLQAEEMMPLLKPLLPGTEDGRAFADWDFGYENDSLQASRFEAIYRELIHAVFGELELGGAVVDFLWDETGVITDYYMQFDRVLADSDSIWFQGRDRQELIRQSIERAFSRPVRPWGEERQVTMRNIFFQGNLPPFLGFDHGPVMLGGNRATIVQGAIYRSFGIPATFAPSYRFITDLATDEAHTVLAGGPSGRRTSRWYLTDVEKWQSGGYKVLKTGEGGDSGLGPRTSGRTERLGVCRRIHLVSLAPSASLTGNRQWGIGTSVAHAQLSKGCSPVLLVG